MKYLKRQTPIIAAFVAGFAVMSLEILGSRLVAPIVGSSVLVWTNLIGVILVALATGAWVGGIIADRFHQEKVVGYMMLGAGTWSLLVVFVSRYILSLFPALPPGTAAPIISLILLAPPAFMLGAIPPALIRLSLKEVSGSGHVAGMLSATGSFGSLLGTYLTGYVLLPLYSVTELLFGIAVLLVIFALFFFSSIFRRRAVVSATGFMFIMTPVALDKQEYIFPSAYNFIEVKDINYHSEPARALIINQGLHAAASPNTLNESIFEYCRGWRAMDSLVTEPKRMLALGGGGFHVVREFLARHPEATADVVEIDPAVVFAAKKTFDINPDPRLNLIIADARTALDNLEPGYDIIVQDTFAGDLSVPWHLLTQEVFLKYKKLLAPSGIYTANIIMGGDDSGEAVKRFNRDFSTTLKTAFNWTGAVTLDNRLATNQPANVLVFAGNGQKPDMKNLATEVSRYATKSNPKELKLLDGGMIWTDDFGLADYESIAMYREAYK
ncbi:MAG: fused MFS/spermidine synthase [Patescibacteria group bacterium]